MRHICIIMLFCYRNKAHGELHQTDFMASWEGYGQVAKAEEDPYPNSRLLVAHRCVNTASWRAFRVWMLFQLSAKKPETFSPSSIITGISTMMHAFTDCEPQDVRTLHDIRYCRSFQSTPSDFGAGFARYGSSSDRLPPIDAVCKGGYNDHNWISGDLCWLSCHKSFDFSASDASCRVVHSRQRVT